MSRLTRASLLGGAASLGALQVGRRPATAQPARFTGKCGIDNQPTHPAVRLGTAMFASIDRETEGAVQVQMFPNSILGSQTSR